MTKPQLLFLKHEFKSDAIQYLKQENVVAHITFADAHTSRVDRILYGRPPKAIRKGNTDPNSPFQHKRHDCARHGKFLQFESSNSIRAGKRTHSDAVHSAYLFRKYIGNPKISAIASPNLVVSGLFKHQLDIDAIKCMENTNYSDKFPGISLEVAGLNKVTPEIYPSKTRPPKFIIPGLKSPYDLQIAIKALENLPRLPTNNNEN